MSSDLLEKHPYIKNFGELKMPNCSVARCDVNFDLPATECFTSLELLFGAEFKTHRTSTVV